MSKGAGRRAAIEHLAAEELARKARLAERAAAKPIKPTAVKAGRAAPSRPMTAAERRAKDFARVQLQPDASALPANADVQVERAERASEGQRGNVERARRMDAFLALRDGMEPGAYDKARRLEADVLERRGEADHGRALERIDGHDPEGCATDRMLAAAARVDAVLRHIGERDAWLLLELIAPSTPATRDAASWRDVVAYVTGETHSHGQGAAVRSACANLARAYRQCDEPSRKAA